MGSDFQISFCGVCASHRLAIKLKWKTETDFDWSHLLKRYRNRLFVSINTRYWNWLFLKSFWKWL